VLHCRTPINLVPILDVVVLLDQFIDAVIDAALRDHDVVALLKHLKLLFFDHIVVLPKIGLHRLFEALAYSIFHQMLHIVLGIGQEDQLYRTGHKLKDLFHLFEVGA
jgi:hypothetical protein